MRSIAVVFYLLSFSLLVDAAARSYAAATEYTRTSIIADQEHGIVRILIDGKEIARFDSGGLQVRESVEYGGTMTDVGTAYFDEHTAGASAP